MHVLFFTYKREVLLNEFLFSENRHVKVLQQVLTLENNRGSVGPDAYYRSRTTAWGRESRTWEAVSSYCLPSYHEGK